MRDLKSHKDLFIDTVFCSVSMVIFFFVLYIDNVVIFGASLVSEETDEIVF